METLSDNGPEPVFSKKALIAAGIALALVLVIIFIYGAVYLIFLLLAGIMVSVLLQEVAGFVSRKIRLSYRWVLLLVILLIIGTLVSAGVLMAPLISEQISQIPDAVSNAWKSLGQYLARFQWGDNLMGKMEPEQFFHKESGGISGALSQILGIFSNTVTAITAVVFILLTGIYMAAEPTVYRNGLLRLIPLSKRDRWRELLSHLYHVLAGWMLGQTVAMAVLAIIMTTGLWFLDIPLALLLGLFVGLMTFIPYIGPIIGGVPALLMALSVGPSSFLYVGALFLFAQNLEGSLLTPMVQRKLIDMPPVVILSVQVLMLNLMGFLGVLVATPMVACVMEATRMLYVEDILGDDMDRPMDDG